MIQTVTVGEHLIILPELTKSSEVLFVKEKDAYWRRELLIKEYRNIWFDFIPHITLMDEESTLYDERGVLIQLNKEDSAYIDRIYKQEDRRRRFGVWFKNGDKFEYITGDHYFLLMWAKMTVIGGSNYAEYREFQRDYFYLIKKVNEPNNKCLGLYISKPKKTGITNCHWIYYLNKATLHKNQNMGNMNINKDQGSKTFRDYFMYAFNGLPSPLKPQVKTVGPMEGRIEFGMSYSNSKAQKLRAVQDPEAELNSNVFCVATAAKAFDVAKMDDTWYDEPPKYKESIEEIFNTNMEAIKMGNYINGRAWFTSYTPDEDSRSFQEARKIFLNSELKTIKDTGTGMTKSQLWCWHIPSYASWIGDDNTCFNKYGKCDEQRANKEIDADRKAAGEDKRKKQALIRQYAKDKREAWSSAGAGSTFDLIHLGNLLADIELDQQNSPDNPYIEGNLVWENPLWEIGKRDVRKKGEFCNVKFEPLTDKDKENKKKAKYRLYRDIHASNKNMALKQGRDEHGNLLPPQTFLYSMGGDPTAYAAGSEVVQASKNAGGILRLPDMLMDTRMGEIVTNTMDIEYYDRPEMPTEAYEDFLKMIIYSGAITIIEANQKHVATTLMEEGLGYYMIVKDENGIITTWKPWMGMTEENKTYKLIVRTNNQAGKDEVLTKMVMLLINYFYEAKLGEKYYAKTCKSDRLLHNMMDFDPTDTTKSDILMAWGYALIAASVYEQLQLKPKDDSQNPDYFRAMLRAIGFVN